MRRQITLAFAAGVLFGLGATGVASAADIAVKARPVVAPLMYNWTGCPENRVGMFRKPTRTNP
jgi:outer membrane immunogenic protein